MIYTGYYAKLKQYKDNEVYTLAISRTVPPFYSGQEWKDLSPRPATLWRYKTGEIDEFQFTEEYKDWLNSLDKKQIKEDILNLLNSHESIIFLCYEKVSSFCHRHILADWLEENLGLKVEEYPV